MTLQTILKEIKEVPINRLEELYQFVHSLTIESEPTESKRKKILSFGRIFNDMNENDYKDFVSQTIKTRAELFDRKIDI